MNVDAVILANTANPYYYGLTMRVMNTLRYGQGECKINVVVVESNGGDDDRHFNYHGCTVIRPEPPFNYNRFMNAGLALCDAGHVLMCNNDITFTPGSVGLLVGAMAEHGLQSACPLEPDWHRVHYTSEELSAPFIMGHRVMKEMVGWCVCATREALERATPLDEAFDYYYQDNDYAMTLMSLGLRHGLVTSARVRHDLSCSERLMAGGVDETSSRLKAVFEAKWPQASSLQFRGR